MMFIAIEVFADSGFEVRIGQITAIKLRLVATNAITLGQ